jgi:branched-subunit amino acid transport protein AzlD
MMEGVYVLAVIAAMGLTTFVLRALPFLASHWLQDHPLVRSLGRFLPLAIMSLLLVNAMLAEHADKNGGPWPELACVAMVALLQGFFRNALLSILTGTGVYVVLRNFI